jgi:myo-inositol-hexaphosphate 3-phosphohydrolase
MTLYELEICCDEMRKQGADDNTQVKLFISDRITDEPYLKDPISVTIRNPSKGKRYVLVNS